MERRVASNLGILTFAALAAAVGFRLAVSRTVDAIPIAEIAQIRAQSERAVPSIDAPPPRDPIAVTASPLVDTPASSARPARAPMPKVPLRPLVRHVSRAELDAAIDHGVGSASLSSVAGDDGRPIGLRVKSPGDLAVLGVQAGDVLVSANGLPIDTADRALAALGKLRDARTLNVVFRRGESTYALSADVE